MNRTVPGRGWIIGFALCATSCAAGFRTGEFSGAEVSRAKNPERSVSIAFTGEVLAGDTVDATTEMMSSRWSKITLDTYRDSLLFSRVEEGLQDTDLRVEARLVRDSDTNFWPFILTVIQFPVIDKSQVTLTTVFKDPEGGVLGEFEKTEQLTVYVHLVPTLGAFVLFPFALANPSMDALDSIVHDLNVATLAEAAEAGIVR